MEQFNLPSKLNGAQLIAELNGAGIAATKCLVDGNQNLLIDIPSNKKSQAEIIVNAHIGMDTPPTLADKLAGIGLSIDELKAALNA